MAKEENRMIWSGACDSCPATVLVYADSERPSDVDDSISETWPEDLHECLMPDCDGEITWNGSDPVETVLLPRML
jgi:hypothetical protein